ncbi:hypothetical protein OG413_31000 [Streptomyces sp. NBC_01433]|uniref:hypothetical protein n=1 Tax=Streptomyces sp. NBC_01433 TaxID=2903864 RepID=UPI00224DD89D|nr:hypothetical protein [Streptomyces sp. NBC_01433]MCX4679661.1 hypothetical protein [Streptomyces sp. NBC_01433]
MAASGTTFAVIGRKDALVAGPAPGTAELVSTAVDKTLARSRTGCSPPRSRRPLPNGLPVTTGTR